MSDRQLAKWRKALDSLRQLRRPKGGYASGDSVRVVLSPGLRLYPVPHEALRHASEADRTLSHASALGLDQPAVDEVLDDWREYFATHPDPWDWSRIREDMTRRAIAEHPEGA